MPKKSLSHECLEEAYYKIGKADRRNIDRMAQTIENNVKARAILTPHPQEIVFGRLEALELLAKIGMMINREGL